MIMTIERQNIGKLIKEQVKEKGMSQAEFARLIGMARQNVAKLVFEKKRAQPTNPVGG